MWVVAQLAEHRIVTAATEGSTPFDPPKDLLIDRSGEMEKGRRGDKANRGLRFPISASGHLRNCGREVRHLIVDQVDDGSSPFSSANI